MSMQVDNSGTSSVTFGQLGPTSSLQLMFARLQLELAGTAKSQAMDKMDAIAEAQDEQKLVSRLLNEARDKKANTTEAAESSTVTYKNVAKRDENGKIMRDGNGEIIREDRTETIEKGKKWSAMSQEMVDYVDEHDLAMDNTLNDHLQREEQWDVLITSLSPVSKSWARIRSRKWSIFRTTWASTTPTCRARTRRYPTPTRL